MNFLTTIFLNVGLSVFFSSFSYGANYEIPVAPAKAPNDENTQLLVKISTGFEKLAGQASAAVVYVSISKPVEGAQNMMDPFEFFFGPNAPFFGPRDRRFRGPSDNQNQPKQRIMGIGSGFIVDLDKGYIITNNHVVEGADEIHLKVANGKIYVGKVVGSDSNTDVAVVQIKDKKYVKEGLAALVLGDSDAIKVGDLVLALGAPFGLEASVTFGVISATKRGPLEIAKIGNFIQTDAAINPGNSGGPLLNIYGQVIGVNTAIYSNSGGYAGVGMAVPSNLVRTIAQELLSKGKIERGYIGVQLTEIGEDVGKDLKVPEGVTGVLVTNVVKDEPADKAGVQPGDVIAEVNGKPIKGASDIVTEIGLAKPGTDIKLTLYREGKKQEIKVKIKPYGPNGADQITGKNSLDWGMALAKIDPSLSRKFNLESKSGLVVIDIDPNSMAGQAGIQVGDVILDCNSQKLKQPEDFSKCAKDKKRLLIRLERARQYFYVILQTP